MAESSVINVKGGILGLEENTRFFILDTENEGPFKWMQSLDDPDVAFIVADPFEVFANYDPQITETDATEIDLEDAQDMGLIVLLTVPGDPSLITANLLAPLVINLESRLCKQVVLSDPQYSTRHRVFPSEAGQKEGTL